MNREPQQSSLYHGFARKTGNDSETGQMAAAGNVTGTDGTGERRVLFGPGITLTDLDVVHRGSCLVVNVAWTDDAMVVCDVEAGKIPSFVFNDGTMLSGAEVESMARMEIIPQDD